MSGPEFFQTRMGRQFFEGTMPRIEEALSKIAERLEPAGAFSPGDLVVAKLGDGDPGEFKVVRSNETGLHLEDEDGRELTLVVKRRVG